MGSEHEKKPKKNRATEALLVLLKHLEGRLEKSRSSDERRLQSMFREAGHTIRAALSKLQQESSVLPEGSLDPEDDSDPSQAQGSASARPPVPLRVGSRLHKSAELCHRPQIRAESPGRLPLRDLARQSQFLPRFRRSSCALEGSKTLRERGSLSHQTEVRSGRLLLFLSRCLNVRQLFDWRTAHDRSH